MNEFVAELQKSLIADLLNVVLEYVNIHILPEKSLLHFITCYNPCLHIGHYIVVARICERFTQQFRDKQVLAECRARFSNRAEYRYLLNYRLSTISFGYDYIVCMQNGEYACISSQCYSYPAQKMFTTHHIRLCDDLDRLRAKFSLDRWLY